MATRVTMSRQQSQKRHKRDQLLSQETPIYSMQPSPVLGERQLLTTIIDLFITINPVHHQAKSLCNVDLWEIYVNTTCSLNPMIPFSFVISI